MRRRTMPNFLGDVSSLEERQARLERLLQMIGISPDMPYTMTVNDGTRNRVEIGLIGSDYGIKIVDNAGNNIILANGTIIANAIKSGTLDCGLITVTNLNAGSITVGTLSASRISGGTLNCNLMTVSNLNAGSITVGTFVNINDRLSAQSITGEKIQVGTLNADRISAGTITADKIYANTITTNQLALNGVNADRLTDNTVSNAKILSLSADKLTAGTIYVGFTGRPGTITIRRNGSDGFLTWEGGNKIWSDGDQFMGFTSNGERFYFYTGGANLYALFQRGSPANFYTGMNIYGGCYVESNFRVAGQLTGDLNFGSYALTNCGNAWITVLNNNTINNTTLYGNNIWYWNLNYYSDEILKRNIKDRTKSLEDILKLRPIEFEYKKEKSKRKHIGFLAGEVEKVLPNLVSTDDKGMKGINITEIIPLLVGAIQELKKEVELLKEVNKNGKN